MIASKFTDAKAGGNPIIEELVYPEDPEDEEIKEILKMLEEVSPKDSKKISEDMKKEYEKAEKAKAAAEEAAAKDRQEKEKEEKARQAAIDEAKSMVQVTPEFPPPPTINATDISPNNQFLDKINNATTKFNSSFQEFSIKFKNLTEKNLNMLIDAEIAEIKTLAIEKTYDVLKKTMR